MQSLGPPYYKADGVSLYAADCVETLRLAPRRYFDLVITSPPYNIGKEYDKDLAIPDYLNWCETWMKTVYDVTKSDGAFWLNLGYVSVPGRGHAVPLPYMLWDKSPFYLLQEVVWHYGAGVAAKRSFSPRNEKFLWYVADPQSYHFDLDAVRDPNVKYPNQKKDGKLKCNPKGKNPSDVWVLPKVTSGANRSSKERTPHPAQFPTAVIERIIRACSKPGDLVLDPFIGSGTVAEVALRLGRRVVGIDINTSYLDIAASRLDRAMAERASRLPL